jgi:stage II sporulation protein GA (sporulation sigma-E factor processing peptidase)
MILYFDVLLLINLIMNYIILYFVALILNLKRIFRRVIFGALLGCLFLIGVIWEKYVVLQYLSIKVIISAAMIFVSFRPGNFRDFFKILGFFYLISFMMGGGVLAFFYLLNLGENPLTDTLIINNISVPWWILLISAFTSFIFLKYLWPLIYRVLTKDTLLVHVIIFLDEKSTEVTALIDTGNDLFDPVSNYPVIIVELSAMKNIISKDLAVILKKGPEKCLSAIGESVASSRLASRFRVIPFESIGKSKGLMVGFKPDKVTIEHDNKTKITKNAIIGIYQRVLSPEGTYRALLNPILLNE